MKHFGEPEDALFRVEVRFSQYVKIPIRDEFGRFDFSTKHATMRISLRPKFESVKEAEAFLYHIFGTGDYIGDISISYAIISGANDSAKKWLEDVQIGWENGQFVDLEKYHDI